MAGNPLGCTLGCCSTLPGERARAQLSDRKGAYLNWRETRERKTKAQRHKDNKKANKHTNENTDETAKHTQ